MKSTVRFGFGIVLALLTFACREDKYELRTTARMSGDGRSYLTMEVFRGRQRVSRHSDIEMVPGNGAGMENQGGDGPKVFAYAEFDKEGRGALVTMNVRKGENVLARTVQFVERPIPSGYLRAGMGNGVRPPQAIERFSPLFPDRALRNRRQGVVFVEARINAGGTVDSVVVLNPTPNWDGLDQAAAEAVRQWRFRPATRDGKRVPVAVVQQVHFKLPGAR